MKPFAADSVWRFLSKSRGAFGMRLSGNRVMSCLIGVLVMTCIPRAPARADNLYTFETSSATINGVTASGLDAYGQIIVSAAAVAGGQASVVTSNPETGTPVETLNGITSAEFGFDFGPLITSPDGVIDFTATLSGDSIQIDPIDSYGGFFVNDDDTDAYYAVADSGSSLLTIGYGSDDANSPCFDAQMPGKAVCVVTGEFVYAGDPPPPGSPVPEPASIVVFLGSLGMLGGLLWRVGRSPIGAAL